VVLTMTVVVAAPDTAGTSTEPMGPLAGHRWF
jgi:hypothetical protein